MPFKRTTVFTRKDIIELCVAANPEQYLRDPIISDLRPAFSKKLRAREFTFLFADGGKIDYRFDRFGVCWREEGEEWNEETAEVLESTREGVFLVHHLRTHVNPFEAATLVIDTNSNLVTMIYDKIGKASQTRDIDRKVRFGWFGEKPAQLQDLTDELIGKVIDWKYADDIIIHTLYCNVQCLAFISPLPAKAPGWEDYFPTFNPTKYIKIAEELYLVSFYAPHACGMEVSMLIDLKKMRAVGATFGFDSTDKFCSYTFGAKGAFAQLGFLGLYTVQ